MNAMPHMIDGQKTLEKKVDTKTTITTEAKSDNPNFCILPWMHLYAEPNGDVFPCCTAVPYPGIEELKGSLKDNTLAEIYHSDKWNKLRKDMMEGKRNDACTDVGSLMMQEDLHIENITTIYSRNILI